MTQSAIQDLIQFLNKSPTAHHACMEMEGRLHSAGFHELKEGMAWEITWGNNYFVRRGASLIAFCVPEGTLDAAVILAGHTDSPGLKLKPHGEFEKDDLILLNFDVYGSPILASWVGRDLALAGRIFYEEGKKTKSELVYFKNHPLFISHLAIHLDRTVNDAGLVLNKQEHLSAIACHKNSLPEGESFLGTLFGEKEILHTELFATLLEEARLFGLQDELLVAYRLDNLVSCHAALKTILDSKKSRTAMQMMALWNHEEVGSETQEGASSSFFNDTLKRISFLLGQNQEEFFRLKANSITLSIDVAHGAHPNYSEKYEMRHKALLGNGTCIKLNAQERYTASGNAIADVMHRLRKEDMSLQTYITRSDIPSGSTIGPLTAAKTGIQCLDVGIPLLGMHAARECIHVGDYMHLCRVLQIVLG